MVPAALRDHGLIDQTSKDVEGAERNSRLPNIGNPSPNIKHRNGHIIGEKCDVVHCGLTRVVNREVDDARLKPRGLVSSPGSRRSN